MSTLKGLNEQRLEYIRMTTRLFLEECNHTTILEQLLVAEMHLPLFEVMQVDAPFRGEFIRVYLELEGKGHKVEKVQGIANQMMLAEAVSLSLQLESTDKCFPQRLRACVRLAEEDGVSNFAGCLVEGSESISLPKFISLITGCLKDKMYLLCEQSQQLLMQKLFEYLESEEKGEGAIVFLLKLLTFRAKGKMAELFQMKKALL